MIKQTWHNSARRIPQGVRRFSFLATVVSALTLLPSHNSGVFAQAAGHHFVNKLVLGNCGTGSTRHFRIHWGRPGAQRIKQVNRVVSPNQSTCFDLASLGIPSGASVSVSYEISAGIRIACDIGHSDLVYAPTAQHSQLFIAGGTTAEISYCQAHGSIRVGGTACPTSHPIICP